MYISKKKVMSQNENTILMSYGSLGNTRIIYYYLLFELMEIFLLREFFVALASQCRLYVTNKIPLKSIHYFPVAITPL